jgi:hypothetical protein
VGVAGRFNVSVRSNLFGYTGFAYVPSYPYMYDANGNPYMYEVRMTGLPCIRA